MKNTLHNWDRLDEVRLPEAVEVEASVRTDAASTVLAFTTVTFPESEAEGETFHFPVAESSTRSLAMRYRIPKGTHVEVQHDT